jgi:hypothetical protein
MFSVTLPKNALSGKLRINGIPAEFQIKGKSIEFRYEGKKKWVGRTILDATTVGDSTTYACGNIPDHVQ